MNKDTLKSVWLNLLAPITTELEAKKEWGNIVEQYSQTHRHYHTLQHLEEMYTYLSAFYSQAIPTTSLLALFYHDFEYRPLRSDNEEQSALYAERKLTEWRVPQLLTNKIVEMIHATKLHTAHFTNTEMETFLDADMAILGGDTNSYQCYCEQVRKEYNVYPDFLYRKGRKAFLEATLRKQCIFAQPYFRDKFELQARINLESELKQLR